MMAEHPPLLDTTSIISSEIPLLTSPIVSGDGAQQVCVVTQYFDIQRCPDWHKAWVYREFIRGKGFFRRYEKVPVILVGNKVDLESEREVSSSEGRALAEEWGCPFMETSAKSKTMVDELFAEIVRQMNYAAQPDKDDPCCSACNIQ